MAQFPSEQLVVDLAGDFQYVGLSPSGTAQDSDKWKIYRVEYISGIISSVKYADGNENYDNKWSDRLTKSYS